MIEFFAMDYAYYVYISFLSFITVVIICTNNAFKHHKNTLDRIKNTIHQMSDDNET